MAWEPMDKVITQGKQEQEDIFPSYAPPAAS